MKFEEKNALASALAEDYFRGEFVEMMFLDPAGGAKKLREKSERNEDQMASDVQEYRNVHRCMLSAVYKLEKGIGGYKLERDA